jgi:hypothetical protein
MIGDIEQKRVAEKLSEISELPREALIKDWRLAHKQPPPKGLSRRLLEYSAAYQIQVKAFGGLKPTDRRKLRQTTGGVKNPDPVAKKSQCLCTGTQLLREWHGRTYTVEVINNGFLYDGENYKSLSQVARTITGARWSGPRFFGL